MLNSFEESQIRKNQLFWQWQTPHGSYATHYIEEGAGDRHVLLLHGFAAHAYTWRYQIPFLVEAGYHVWALDYVGFGLSDKPDMSYQFDLFLYQIQAFMEAMGLSSAHVIGNSMGGSLALALAYAQPQVVRSLSLLDAVAYPIRLPFFVPLGRLGGSLLFPFINETAVKLFLSQIVYDSSTISQEQVQAYLLPYHMKGGKKALIEMIKHFDFQTMMSLHRCFKDLKQPLLVLWGEGDTLVPTRHFEQFAQDLPQARTVLVNRAAHIPQEEQPFQVNQALLSFLKSLDS